MKYLSTGKCFLQNKNLLRSKVAKLVGFLIKKDVKIEFSDVLRTFELLMHLQSNLAEFWNIALYIKAKNLEHFFSKVLSMFDFIPI